MKKLGKLLLVLILMMCYIQIAGVSDDNIYGPQSAASSDKGVISTSSSPYARLHDVPIHAVRLGEGFWKSRLEANREKSIPALLELLEGHGVVDNFRRLSGRKNVERRGFLFTDSDLFKWMEASAFALQSDNDREIKRKLDEIIDEVLAAQGDDGYLNTYHVDERADQRFTNFAVNHELYCLGHLIQAAIAYYRGHGDRKLLNGAIRYIDYIMSIFGPGKRQCFPGHPEIEMALVELYRTTGDRKYLEFSGYLLNDIDLQRIEEEVSDDDFRYTFAGLPFTSRRELRSHAVRAMYACCGATDYYMETGDEEVWKTLEILWNDMSRYKMYVTGGVGSRYRGEAFGNPYELPNERAYTETCAAIGNIMWNWRMLNATGEARFTDIMERALYNGFLAGVSMDGCHYFYRNPLLSLKNNERQPWYECTCCPPNVERMLASLPGYMYSTSKEGIWVHLYHSSELDWRLENGTGVMLTQETEYPWKGRIVITVTPEKKEEFSLFVRLPQWSAGARVTVNGEWVRGDYGPGTYCEINRVWNASDKLEIMLSMRVQTVFANPRVSESSGKIAIRRGPLVYCMESTDNSSFSLFDVVFPLQPRNLSEGFSVKYLPKLLGGMVVLEKSAISFNPPLDETPLYSNAPYTQYNAQVRATMIPYYAWANRGITDMTVWVPYLYKDRKFYERGF